jgi:hypothetical protein
LKSTLKRESKGREIANRETMGASTHPGSTQAWYTVPGVSRACAESRLCLRNASWRGVQRRISGHFPGGSTSVLDVSALNGQRQGARVPQGIGSYRPLCNVNAPLGPRSVRSASPFTRRRKQCGRANGGCTRSDSLADTARFAHLPSSRAYMIY